MVRTLILSVALMLSASAPAVGATNLTQAGCRLYDSRTVPPKTIRVWNQRTGRVVRVSMKHHVMRVMASGEWPGWWPREGLRLGAIATKQWQWWRMLHEAHRTPDGRCYDVRAHGGPELAAPIPTSIRRAVELTWSYSIRKHGRFILTGWRSWGGRCGTLKDGFRLYQHGVGDCARRGRGWKQIARIYYGKGFELVQARERRSPR